MSTNPEHDPYEVNKRVWHAKTHTHLVKNGPPADRAAHNSIELAKQQIDTHNLKKSWAESKGLKDKAAAHEKTIKMLQGVHDGIISGLKQAGYNSSHKPFHKLDESNDIGLKHQLKIAKSTLKMSDAGARIMGGMSKPDAAKLVAKHHGEHTAKNLLKAAGHTDDEIHKLLKESDDIDFNHFYKLSQKFRDHKKKLAKARKAGENASRTYGASVDDLKSAIHKHPINKAEYWKKNPDLRRKIEKLYEDDHSDFLGGEGHLPVKKHGKLSHRLMGAAWAALHGGYRGHKYSGPNHGEALSKLKSLYSREGLPLPESADLAGEDQAEASMQESVLYEFSTLIREGSLTGDLGANDSVIQHPAFEQGKRLAKNYSPKKVELLQKLAAAKHVHHSNLAQQHQKKLDNLLMHKKSDSHEYRLHADSHDTHKELSDKFRALASGIHQARTGKSLYEAAEHLYHVIDTHTGQVVSTHAGKLSKAGHMRSPAALRKMNALNAEHYRQHTHNYGAGRYEVIHKDEYEKNLKYKK